MEAYLWTQENQEHLQKLLQAQQDVQTAHQQLQTEEQQLLTAQQQVQSLTQQYDSSSRTSKKRARGCSTCTGKLQESQTISHYYQNLEP